MIYRSKIIYTYKRKRIVTNELINAAATYISPFFRYKSSDKINEWARAFAADFSNGDY